MKNLPIAVFDSGVGGLTVLKELVKLLPHEKFIYLADQYFCPYGTKSWKQIDDRVKSVARFFEIKAKAIVVACNTASLHIQTIQRISNIPVIGVIKPTCQKALSVSCNKQIGVVATQATINANAYGKFLEEQGSKVISIACSQFVPLVENELSNTSASFEVVNQSLQILQHSTIDTLILGCTHFGFLKKEITTLLPSVSLIECGRATAQALQNTLYSTRLLCNEKSAGWIKFYSTKEQSNLRVFCSQLNLPCLKVTYACV